MNEILKEFLDNNEATDAEVTNKTTYLSVADVETIIDRVKAKENVETEVSKPTCKTCKHFGSQGTFGLVKENGERRYCAAYLFEDNDNDDFRNMPDWKVTYGNMNDAKGQLTVSENFGCINHNPNFDDF